MVNFDIHTSGPMATKVNVWSGHLDEYRLYSMLGLSIAMLHGDVEQPPIWFPLTPVSIYTTLTRPSLLTPPSPSIKGSLSIHVTLTLPAPIINKHHPLYLIKGQTTQKPSAPILSHPRSTTKRMRYPYFGEKSFCFKHFSEATEKFFRKNIFYKKI